MSDCLQHWLHLCQRWTSRVSTACLSACCQVCHCANRLHLCVEGLCSLLTNTATAHQVPNEFVLLWIAQLDKETRCHLQVYRFSLKSASTVAGWVCVWRVPLRTVHTCSLRTSGEPEPRVVIRMTPSGMVASPEGTQGDDTDEAVVVQLVSNSSSNLNKKFAGRRSLGMAALTSEIRRCREQIMLAEESENC